jgi:hypothetical protein
LKILFDQGTPVPLRQHLTEHSVDTAFKWGWFNLRNNVLLHQAEEYGCELLITTNQQLRNQQNLADRQLAVLVLLSTSWPRIRLRIGEMKEVVNGNAAGGVPGGPRVIDTSGDPLPLL